MTKWLRMLFVFVLVFMFSVAVTSAQMDGGELEPGEEVEIEVDDEEGVEFTYEGEEDEVISIIVDADDDSDTRLIVLDEDGEEIANNDDGGPGTNPAIIRLQLPDDGEYTILLEHWTGDEELDDEFEILLLESELLDLNDGPQTVEMGDDFETESMIFEAEEDIQYLVLITASDDVESTFRLEALAEDDFFASTRVSFSGTQSFAFVFEVNDDGMVNFGLDYSSFDGDGVEFTVEVSELD